MATSLRDLHEGGFGATLRRDSWWVAPALTATVLLSFAVYATWAAGTGTHYEWGPYLSPFYSPLIQTSWWPLSPAFLILVFPLGFRVTCYYYRKAYYRAFFLDPVACAVGEARHGYKGESKLPFLLQNVHRFSCARAGRPRYRLWRGVSGLNRHHMTWAWCSLFSVALTDLYIRLCAMGVITDIRIL